MTRVVIAGSHRYTLAAVHALQANAQFKVVAVIPNLREARAVEASVNNKGFQFQVHDQFSVPFITLEEVHAIQADVLLSVMFSQLLTEKHLNAFPLGAWNIHPGLLPAYRGRNINYWTIMNGATEQGLTLHRMVPELDAGDIADVATYPVNEQDTAQDLFLRAEQLVGELAVRGLTAIAKGVVTLQPNHTTGGHLYTTTSVDYHHTNFQVEDFPNAQVALRQLRALTFPLLNQQPTLTKGTQTVTVTGPNDYAKVEALYS